MNDLSPTWPHSTISIQALCNGDIDRPIRITIMDWDKDGGHDNMGSVVTSVRGLVDSRGAPFDVVEEKKQSKKGYKNSGTLTVLNAGIQKRPAFLDFIKGGCEISLSVAIDFGASNGSPENPTSLHHLDPSGLKLNHYQTAIIAVGNVVAEYDTDKRFPVYGFGAQMKFPNGSVGPVQHCFPVGGQTYEVNGVEGILGAYQQCLSNVHLSGPKVFAPLLQATSDAVRAKGGCVQARQQYEILLILTDGIITDMQHTIDAVVAASSLPLSIIIVGVGNADFSGLVDLNAQIDSSRHCKFCRYATS